MEVQDNDLTMTELEEQVDLDDNNSENYAGTTEVEEDISDVTLSSALDEDELSSSDSESTIMNLGIKKSTDSVYSLRKLWGTYRGSFFDERMKHFPAADPETADIIDFFNYYLRIFVEPCGWIGRIKTPIWGAYDIPIFRKKGKVVQVINFLPEKCMFLFTDLRKEQYKTGLLNMESINLNKIYTYFVPPTQIYPLRPQQGVQINYQTLKDVLHIYRSFKYFWYLPHQDGITAKDYFLYGIEENFEALLQLESPKRVGGESQYKELVTTFCRAKKLEEDISTLEFQLELQDQDCEDDQASDEIINKLTFFTGQLELLKPALKQCLSPQHRYARLVEALGSNEDKKTCIYDDEIIIVYDGLSKLNFEVLQKMKNFIATEAYQKDENANPDQVKFSIVECLSDVLRMCKPTCTILLAPGRYPIVSLHELEMGGRIIGFPSSTSKVDIVCQGAGNIWFKVGDSHYKRKVLLELQNLNLTIPYVPFDFTAIIVLRRAKIRIRNCQITTNEKSFDQAGSSNKPKMIFLEEIEDSSCQLMGTIVKGFSDDAKWNSNI